MGEVKKYEDFYEMMIRKRMTFIEYFLYIEENFKEEFQIYEGLIRTENIINSLNIIQRNFSDIKVGKLNDTLWVACRSISIETLTMLLKTVNNLGWFPSVIYLDRTKGKTETIVYSEKTLFSLLNEKHRQIRVALEAKYDIAIPKDETPSIVYHVTHNDNVKKILKIGLAPKSRSKKSYHPERVYLADSLDAARIISRMFIEKYKHYNWSILEIDTNITYLTLLKDPNFKNGFYTLNNIPPSKISLMT